MKNFKGLPFYEGTDEEIMEVISSSYKERTRLRFWFGDTNTGESWCEENDVTGYIGKTTGDKKISILIQRADSTGGGALSTNSIIKIVNTRTHRTLYQHPTFKQDIFSLNEAISSPFIYVFRENHPKYWAKFKTEKSAQRYIDFMNGKRMNK